MPNFEYKTVALPRSVSKRRKRRQSEADMIAEQLGKVLNEEAVDGWEYVRAETLTTPGQSGLLKQPVPAAYVVLIFKRSRGAWEGNPRNEPTPQNEVAPIPQATPEPPVMAAPQPAAPAPVATPAPAPAQTPAAGQEMRFGTTSVQLVSSSDGASVTPMRPLGSAQD